jgi:hypothetical protein
MVDASLTIYVAIFEMKQQYLEIEIEIDIALTHCLSCPFSKNLASRLCYVRECWLDEDERGLHMVGYYYER